MDAVETLEQVHTRLQDGFSSTASLPIDFRLDQLRKLRNFLIDTEADFLAALDADLHKKKVEAIVYDLGPVHQDIAYFDRHLKALVKPKLVSREFGPPVYVQSQPKGAVLIFSSFNFSIMLGLRPLVDAIAAGNAVCLKPSELSVASEQYLKRLTSVLDPRIFGIVTGGPDVCNQLLAFKWDHILFTGSAPVGRIVMEAAAKHLTPVTLELGGKSPAIVSSSADVHCAAGSVAKSRFLNCGQFCLATDYCLVDENVYDEFMDKLVAHVRQFYSDDPKNCRHYGRIISSRHLHRLTDLLAKSKGRVLLGGEHDDTAQHYFAPTIVEIFSGRDALMKEEIFGPILPVLKVKNTGEAIKFINQRERPLAMYLFCQDSKITDHVLQHTISGSVGVNETVMQMIGGESFLGGIGESGMGRYGGKEGFETFSHKRPVMYSSRGFGKLFQVLYPNNFGTKDGQDAEGVARLMRFVCKVPEREASDISFRDRIKNAFSIMSTVVTAIGNAICGRKIGSKPQ